MTSERYSGRHTHAVLDQESRERKAAKIISLLRRQVALKGKRILEVGAGSGLISEHIAALPDHVALVVATDVVNQLQTRGIVNFVQVPPEHLPFSNNSFDIVISNHVIEHVGDLECQRRHLAEIHRVLAPDGVLYLAVPNRWRIWEAHYRLPFLSWLPRSVANIYMQLSGRGDCYDCYPLSFRKAENLMQSSGFGSIDLRSSAIRYEAERAPMSSPARLSLRAPQWVLNVMMPIIPTHIFLAHRTRHQEVKTFASTVKTEL